MHQYLETIPVPQATLGIWWTHVPTNIDICSKSSHAQAETLVQQSILHMDSIAADNPLNNGSIAVLAAYGESLTLER